MPLTHLPNRLLSASAPKYALLSCLAAACGPEAPTTNPDAADAAELERQKAERERAAANEMLAAIEFEFLEELAPLPARWLMDMAVLQDADRDREFNQQWQILVPELEQRIDAEKLHSIATQAKSQTLRVRLPPGWLTKSPPLPLFHSIDAKQVVYGPTAVSGWLLPTTGGGAERRVYVFAEYSGGKIVKIVVTIRDGLVD